MANLNKVLIGDFLKRIRRPVNVEKNKEYKLLTVRLHHKGIVLRCVKKGSEIGTKKMYTVEPGDFILSGIDARNGAFGIVPEEMDGAVVTNDFWYFKVDANVIDKRLFLELTQTRWFDEICRKGSDGTTQRIRLQKDKFYNQEIQLPPKVSHDTLLNRIFSVKTCDKNLYTEITHQQSLLKKLRQSILQDAISGKLTRTWRKENPDVEPASEMLARIKVEKARLVKEKKIKKQKPLSPITEREVPFELPKEWVWCRLDYIINNDRNSLRRGPFGSAITKDMFVPKGKDTYKIYEQKNAIKKNHTLGKYYISKEHFKRLKHFSVKPNDIIISCAGTIGEVYLLPDGIEKGIINQALLKINLNNSFLLNEYFLHLFNALIRQKVNDKAKGSAMKNMISINNIRENMVFPIPPLLEQKTIITKVKELFTICDQLESQIGKSQQNSELLMPAVLKEAFES
jgi:restriction endonuclease S subunit